MLSSMSALDEQKADNSVPEALKKEPTSSTQANAMKQETVNSVGLNTAVAAQNGTNGKSGEVAMVVDLTKPLKTEGEASLAESSFIPRSLQLTPTSSAPASSPITPFAPNLGSLSSQLTADEQTAAYKKANILALSALAKKGGPNTKDIFAAQQKLQEFLTSLITLAGQKGPQLKVTVQMLVQNLVTGQISEEEFASRIESDLHSKHQPSLLPFLKDSVPHLKTRLQLQQVVMKELLQKMIAEKRQTGSSLPQPPSAGPPSSSSITTSTSTASSSSSSTSSTSSPATTVVRASSKASTSTQQQQPPQQQQQQATPPTITAVQVVSVANPAHGFVTASVGGGGGGGSKTTTIPGSKVTVGGLPAGSNSLTSQLQLPQTFSQAALDTLALNLPKPLRDKITRLPKEQQKFVYMHHLRQVQQLKEQQQKQQQQQQQQQQGTKVVEAQGQQQQMSFASKSSSSSSSSPSPSLRGVSAVSVGSQMKGGKANFSSMKIVPTSSSPSPTPSGGGGGGKRKGKVASSKDTEIEEDEEVVGMDLLDEVGVNLREETAQFLPQTGTDTIATRSCKDTVFLNLPCLRRRMEAIMRVNGLQGAGEEVLALLSHATQERMRDIVEKITAISQHRVQVLKDDSSYRVQTEVRGQLRVLDAIDRISHKRKQEKEHEQMLRAAKSRSKGADPEKAAKIREEAKQLQQDEAARILNAQANITALAAIGRKRQFPASGDDSAGGGASSSGEGGSGTASNLFGPLAATRTPKRHVTSRDLIFYMEQERETRKSLSLYKTLMKK